MKTTLLVRVAAAEGPRFWMPVEPDNVFELRVPEWNTGGPNTELYFTQVAPFPTRDSYSVSLATLRDFLGRGPGTLNVGPLPRNLEVYEVPFLSPGYSSYRFYFLPSEAERIMVWLDGLQEQGFSELDGIVRLVDDAISFDNVRFYSLAGTATEPAPFERGQLFFEVEVEAQYKATGPKFLKVGVLPDRWERPFPATSRFIWDNRTHESLYRLAQGEVVMLAGWTVQLEPDDAQSLAVWLDDQSAQMPAQETAALNAAPGMALTLYHSSPNPKLTAIDFSKVRRLGDYGPGIYFASDKTDTFGYGGTTYAAQVVVTAPLVLAPDSPSQTEVARIATAFGLAAADVEMLFDADDHPMVSLFGMLEAVDYSSTSVAQVLSGLGYDSVQATNPVVQMRSTKPVHGDYWAIFKPESILSFKKLEVDPAERNAVIDAAILDATARFVTQREVWEALEKRKLVNFTSVNDGFLVRERLQDLVAQGKVLANNGLYRRQA